MKYRRYKIVNFYEDVEDVEFGRAWVVVANTVDLDPSCDAGFPHADLYGKGEFSELFIAPYNSTVVDELEGIAQSGELWSPDMQYWQMDKESQLVDGIPIISHHYSGWANGKLDKSTKNTPRIVSWKPLRQLIIEQQSELKQLDSNKNIFICGNVNGTISPLATRMLNDMNATVDDFKVAMVSVKGATPLPYLYPATNPQSKVVKPPYFHVAQLLELGYWEDAFFEVKKNMEDNLETMNHFFTHDYNVFDSLYDEEPKIDEERSCRYEAFVNHCTSYFLPTMNNLLNVFKMAVCEMDNSYLNFEPEIEDLKKTVDSMLEEPLATPPARPEIK